MSNVPFKEVRVIFNKTGSAMWFSHLDLMRAVSRALRRSHLDIWMSEGFTPRPHIVFTPPLSLGYESTAEIMDFRLNLDAKMDIQKLKDCFPPALKVNEIYYPKTKMKDIVFADYEINLTTNHSAKEIADFFGSPVEMVKKTKRGESTVDITQFIKTFEITETDGGVKIKTTLCCSAEATLNPSYMLTALTEHGFDYRYPSVCRTGFRTESLENFR